MELIEERRKRLVDLVESFPEAVSEVGGDDNQHIGFKVRKKRFAWYLHDHHGDGMVALTCKAPEGVCAERVTANPERFFVPSYSGKRGWLGIRLDLAAVNWDEIAEVVDDGYRLTAPKSLVARLNEL